MVSLKENRIFISSDKFKSDGTQQPRGRSSPVTIRGWTAVVGPHGALLLSLEKEDCGTGSTWMDRGDIALSEMSPSQKDKYS